MRDRLWGLMGRILDYGSGRLPTKQLESLICRILARRAEALGPDEALRFLFRIDSMLYSLEGSMSVRYGDGVHTKHRHIQYHDFFVNRIGVQDRVLDLGCGIGAVAYDVAEKAGARVVAMDHSPENIAQARQRFSHPRVEYLVGDVLQDLPRRPFEVVVLSNILEHLQERVAFLIRVRERVGASRFLVRVPLFERDWRVPLRKELGVEWRLDQTHETEYTLRSFAEELAAAGLKITHQETRWGEIWAEAIPSDRTEG